MNTYVHPRGWDPDYCNTFPQVRPWTYLKLKAMRRLLKHLILLHPEIMFLDRGFRPLEQLCFWSSSSELYCQIMEDLPIYRLVYVFILHWKKSLFRHLWKERIFLGSIFSTPCGCMYGRKTPFFLSYSSYFCEFSGRCFCRKSRDSQRLVRLKGRRKRAGRGRVVQLEPTTFIIKKLRIPSWLTNKYCGKSVRWNTNVKVGDDRLDYSQVGGERLLQRRLLPRPPHQAGRRGQD